MYNFGTWLENCKLVLYYKIKKGVSNMRKILTDLKSKVSMVKFANVCALMVAAYTISVTCAWVHHQPEVPEEAKKLRKF